MRFNKDWAACAWICLALAAGVEVMAQDDVSERARRIHDTAIVIDTHSDTTPKFEETDWDFSERHETGHMDLPRMRDGGFDAQFFSIYMPETPGDGTAIKTALKRIDSVNQTVRKHPDDLVMATTAQGIRDAAAMGNIAALMGIEGGHIIENELAALRMFYALGVRYMTLTHSFHIDWADSAGIGQPISPRHGGLTDFGKEVVREMNRIGMMVDVSHVSDDTFWDVLEVSTAPVFASHSSCRAIANHPRNMSDDMLRAMAEKGGVIQINFFPGYIDEGRAAMMGSFAEKRAAIREQYKDDPSKRLEELQKLTDEFRSSGPVPASVVVDHIEHVIEVVGPDYAGLGADWDGVSELPAGLDECSKTPYITEELLRRGHSEETVRKVLGENLLRFMEAVEAVAE